MEGDDRKGSSSNDPLPKRRTPEADLSSPGQMNEESTRNSSLSSATHGVGTMDTSSMFARASSSAGMEAIPERSVRQRTIPITQDNSARNSTRLLQINGRSPYYHSQTMIPGHWLFEMNYVVDEESDYSDDSDDELFNELLAYDIGNMSPEQLLALAERLKNKGMTEEAIMAKLKSRRYKCSTTDRPIDVDICCICQEEYAEDEEVAKLDCGHEYHVACIKKWLRRKNLCPICKMTALAP